MPATIEDPTAGIRWIESLERLPHQIAATELEQSVLLELLKQNASHLPTDFTVDHVKSETEGPFKVSFLLPIGPLSSEDLGNLTTEFGCAVCGEKAAKRCSKCQGVWYCSKGTSNWAIISLSFGRSNSLPLSPQECQRADWQEHKVKCRPLGRESWVTIPFSLRMHIPGMDTSGLRVGSILSNRSAPGSKKKPRDFDVNSDSPPQNIHGDNPFIIKLQPPLSGGPGTAKSMLVYDRQKSVMGYVYESEKPEEFGRLRRECIDKGLLGGLKMYRYAKRVGDWELSICVEREPEGVVNW